MFPSRGTGGVWHTRPDGASRQAAGGARRRAPRRARAGRRTAPRGRARGRGVGGGARPRRRSPRDARGARARPGSAPVASLFVVCPRVRPLPDRATGVYVCPAMASRGGLSSDPAKARRQLESLAKHTSGKALEGIDRRLAELDKAPRTDPPPAPPPSDSPTSRAVRRSDVERVDYDRQAPRTPRAGRSRRRDRSAGTTNEPTRQARPAPPPDDGPASPHVEARDLPGFLDGALAPFRKRPRG